MECLTKRARWAIVDAMVCGHRARMGSLSSGLNALAAISGVKAVKLALDIITTSRDVPDDMALAYWRDKKSLIEGYGLLVLDRHYGKVGEFYLELLGLQACHADCNINWGVATRLRLAARGCPKCLDCTIALINRLFRRLIANHC